MASEKYLSEEKYQEDNKKVKKIGKTLLIVGVVILIISAIIIVLGFFGFGNTAVNSAVNSVGSNASDGEMQKTAAGIFGSFGLIALGGFVNTIGFGLTIAGAIVMIISHRREITAYTTQQVMPVAQEGIEKMAPTIGNAAREITRGIKEGLNDAEKKD